MMKNTTKNFLRKRKFDLNRLRILPSFLEAKNEFAIFDGAGVINDF